MSTYGDIATVVSTPRAARQVGWALAALGEDALDPTGEGVPWHRVINAQGRVSGRGQTIRAEIQHRLLVAEGIEFDADGRCDLQRLRWRLEPALVEDGGAE